MSVVKQKKIQGSVLVSGIAKAEIISTDKMLSFWGGFNQYTGVLIDQHHPLANESLKDKVFVLPKGKGSSTGSPILVDAIMSGNAPSGILLKEVDEIMAIGCIVCKTFFDKSIPLIVLQNNDFETALIAKEAIIHEDGTIDLFF